MSSNKTDVVGEYLREIELRLGSLPLLQRRELLADLEAHIAAERAERGVQSEGELLEILERLGSPEVVAAAAYEEAGVAGAPAGVPPPFVRLPAPRTPRWPGWLLPALVAGAVVFLLIVALALVSGRGERHSVPDPLRVPGPGVVVPAPPLPR